MADEKTETGTDLPQGDGPTDESVADLSIADLELVEGPPARAQTAPPPPPPSKTPDSPPPAPGKAMSKPPTVPAAARSKAPPPPSLRTPPRSRTSTRPGGVATGPRAPSVPNAPAAGGPVRAAPLQRTRTPILSGSPGGPSKGVPPVVREESELTEPATALAAEESKGPPQPFEAQPSEAAPSEAEPLLDARSLVKRCQRELAEGPEPLRAARLHYEMARMYEGVLEDPTRAGEHYMKAAHLMPEHAPSLRGARRGLIAGRRYKEALALYDKEVRITAEQRGRARLLYEKGRLLEDALADLDAALEAFHAGLELAPDDRSILKAIERCERRSEAWPALSRTFDRVARLVENDPPHRAALLAERARLAEIREGDDAQALQLYSAALDVDAHAPAALSSLKRLAQSRHDWRELVAALRREQAQATSPRARADALQLIAHVLDDHLGDVTAATKALEEAVEYAQEDRGLRRRLADLYRAGGRHEDHASVLMALSESTRDLQERIALCQRIARIFEDHLDDAGRARRWYEIGLELNPTFRPTLQALAKLYERVGDWEALIAVLRREASSVDEPDRKATAHARIAEVLENELNRPDEAAAEHARVLGWTPGHEPSFKSLMRLYASAGRWLELIELLQRAVDTAPDDERTIAFLFRIGGVQEDQIGDHAGAVHAYNRILELAPGNLGAIHALQRAAERAGRYQELVQALDLEAGLSDDRARVVSLRYFAAEVLEDNLDDTEGAIRRLSQVLTLDRTHLPALTAIGRLYHKAGRWEDLLENRKALLHVTTKGAASVDLLFEMGELCRTRLGREGDAIAHYRRALAVDTEHDSSYHALVDVLTSRCAWEELAKLLEERIGTRKAPEDNARLAMELGGLLEEHVRKADRALDAYERALSAVPGHRPALDARARLLAEKGAWKQLDEDLSREAVGVPNETLSSDAKLRQGEVRAHRLNDLGGAIRCYEWVLEHSPGHVGALLALEDLHLRMRHRDELAKTYEQQSVALVDPGAKVAALRELARIATDQKGDPEQATAAYGRILEILPDDEEALTALAADPESPLTERIRLEVKLAAAAREPSLIAYRQVRVAELLEESGSEDALGAYRAALALDPESLTAVRGFTRAALATSDPAALREAGQREAKVTRDIPRAVELLLGSASARRSAGRSEEAVEDVEKAIDLDPEHEGAARALTETFRSLGRVPRLLELLGRAAERARNPERIAALHTAVARLQVEEEGKLPAAVASLGRALKAVPTSLPALELLADSLEKSEQWSDAADALRKLIRHATSETQRMDAHLRLAAIADERLGDRTEAQKSLKEVLDREPDNRLALGRLARIHAVEGRRDQALELSRRLADAAKSPEERASALVAVAKIERALGKEAEAATALQEAFAMEGPESEAAEAYRGMIAESSPYASWDEYLGALLRHLDLSARIGKPLGPTYLAMANVFGDQLNRPDRSFGTLREGITRLPDDVPLSISLADRLSKVSAHDKVVEEMRRLLSRTVEVPDAWRRLARGLRAMGQEEEAVVALLPLQIIGGASPEEVMTMRGRRIRAGLARPGIFGDAGIRQVQVGDAHDAPAAALLASLSDALRKLYPTEVGSWGLSKRDRLRAGADDPLRVATDRVAGIFGVPEVDLYVHDVSATDVSVQLGSPPALLVPSWARQLSQAQMVFLLARPLANVARELHAIDRIPPGDLAVILVASARTVSPGYGVGLHSEEAVEERQREVTRALSRRTRRLVEEAAAHYAAAPLRDVAGWIEAVRQTSARAAMLLADDVVSAVEVTQRTRTTDALDESACDLMRFWVSDTATRYRRANAG